MVSLVESLRGLGLFSGHLGLWSKMPPVRQKTQLSLQHLMWICSLVGGQSLLKIWGIQNAFGSSRCGRGEPHCIIFKSWAGQVQASDCQGFRYVEKEVGANEWKWTSQALWQEAVQNPLLFCSRDLVKCPSCLLSWASIFCWVPGEGGLTKTKFDELSRVDLHDQGSSQGVLLWPPGLRTSLCPFCGCGKRLIGKLNLGWKKKSYRLHPNTFVKKKRYCKGGVQWI